MLEEKLAKVFGYWPSTEGAWDQLFRSRWSQLTPHKWKKIRAVIKTNLLEALSSPHRPIRELGIIIKGLQDGSAMGSKESVGSHRR